MSKFKKIFATMIGTAMSANVLLTIPFSAFADNISQTFEFDGYTVGYEVENSWGNTEVISLTLTNTGTETIEDWMLYFDPNGEIQYVNDAVQMTTTNGIGYIKNPGYNADIDPGASVEFHYAVNDCEEIPSDYRFCQSRMTKETGYDVSLKVNYTWGSNNEYFNGEIIIQNDTDAPIEAWELKTDTNFTITEITNSWAADVTELEPYNYMLKGTYTSIIPAGGSVSLGFNGMREGEPIISDYSLTEVVVDESVINSIINGGNKDDEFYNDCIDWSTLPDSDGDGLPDEYEEEYGCDPTNPDTDGDGLPDGYEIMTIGSNPADVYSLDNTLSDGEYDNDQDELSNYEEYLLGTDPLRADSDFDSLSDGDEVNVYGTDPLNPDTDDDGLSDGDEIALGLNPLVADSNGDGIPDNEEKFSQSMTYDTEDSDIVIDSINVSFEGTGYINSTTSVENIMDTDWMCSNVVGLIGNPYDISSDSSFDTATLIFTVDKSSLGDTQFDDLAVLWYNEEEQRFVEMETISDIEVSTLTATVTHFSKYLIVDCNEWYDAWLENNYPDNGNILHTAITIDCSTSTEYTDPNFYRVTAANSFVDVMKAADLVSVILFSDGASIEQELTNNQTSLHNAINNVFHYGTTNYEAAIQQSMAALSANSNNDSEDIIIFLSDGAPTEIIDGYGIPISPEDFDYSIIDAAADAGIKIYTIGLSTTPGSDGETILKEIADRTNGEYYYAATAEGLVAHFLTINMSKKYDITTDTDGDGLPDLFETYGMPIANGQVIFTDANDTDSDSDTLTDGEEIIMHVVDNDEEVRNAYKYMYDYIPDIFISDNGGIYFELITDPTNEDTDEDGISDYDEIRFYETDPNEEDTDRDGILDGVESQNLDKLHPTVKDTIYSLYPELHNKSNKNNQENNAVYIEVKENSNDITFNIRIVFDEFADYIAADYLNADIRNDYVNEIVSRIGKEFDQISLKDLILDGIEYRWCHKPEDEMNGTFLGSDYDFYPGLNPKVKFNLIVVPKNGNENYDPITQHAVTYHTDPSVVKVSNAGWENQEFTIDGKNYTVSNPRIVLTRSYTSIDGPYENFITYEGTAAHEFGHVLGLPDAYPGGDINQYCNNGFSCASNNPGDEIYINDNSNLSYPNAGEIMWVNGSAVSNDIEMLLWKYETGNAQRFTPNYNESLSPAIRQVIGYKYTNKYDGVMNQPYSLNQKYIFINNKGYVPIDADIKTFDSGEGYCLQYFSEEIGNTTGITIYGLSENSQHYSGNVYVPSAIEGISVIKISDGAFMNSAISSVTLPDSIVTIGQRAFYECSNLHAITIPNNVEVIRPYTFFGCTALNTITSPDSLKYIAINACEGCAITSFYIPAATEYIYENAFNNCVYIQSYSVNQGNVNYSSDFGVLFHKYKDSDSNIKIELLKYPANKSDTNYVIPNTTNKIASDAFLYNKKLTEIIIPNSVEFIGWGAFSETNLVTATIPSSVKEVQHYVFYHCKQLQSVTILSSNPLCFADDLFFYRNSNEYSPLIVYVPADSVDEFKQRFVDYVAKGYDIRIINDEGV